MELRNNEKYKAFYEWLTSVCNPDIVERLDCTLGDYEADRILSAFLEDVHSDGHIEVYKGFTVSKNPEVSHFDELADHDC